jgi:hypothetical protein
MPHRDLQGHRQQIGALALLMTSQMDVRGLLGALSMTSPMDATEEGEQNILKQINLNMYES